jgi:endonuclease/exonuclease/phosphatase (EEP) superfamily protein YafD
MWTVLGWLVLLGLAAIAATSLLGISGRAVVALAQDALLYLLALAWIVLVVALLARSWYLAGAAALVVAYHLALMISRLTKTRLPRWVRHAPRLNLVVANVFIDNETPAALARGLLAAGGDLIVILEWNAAFVSAFDAEGGGDAYPERLFDPADQSDYAVGIVSKLPLLPESEIVTTGPLKLTQAVVEVGGRPVTVIGLNPMAAVDPGGFEEWEKQLDALIEFVPSVAEPLVVAGDLNTTTLRPKVQELLATGLFDAHESLGQGLSPSFKLSADGVLSAPGAVVRLDHALVSHGVRAISAEDLQSDGSDHLPFLVTLAIRPGDHSRHGRDSGFARGSRPARPSTSA